VLALLVLTGLGDRRRGHGLRHAVFAGLFFPVTWTAWYLVDMRRFQRSGVGSLER
jgi:hypothetical protein